MFTGLQAKLYALGGLVLAFLAMVLRMQALKNGRDKARQEADTLKARAHVQKTQRQIKRKEKERLSSRRADLVKELQKEGEEFEGVDNFSNPNEF